MYGGGGFGGFSGFDNGGGGGGFLGGFFTSPQKGDGGTSPMGGGRAREAGGPTSSRDSQGLMAVTVKMVTDAASQTELPESNLLRFHGNHEASMIELIGQVESVQESEGMYLRYLLDDGTGKMVCKKLIEPNGNRAARVQIGRFVRVIGSYRHFGSETYINAHKVEEMRSIDEISRHRIEVVHSMLLLTGQLEESASSGVVSGAHASMSSENVHPNQITFPVGSSEWFLDQVQRTFGPRGPRYNASTGVSRQQLYIQFASYMSTKQIDENIQALYNQGIVFSTIDDNHFQLTA